MQINPTGILISRLGILPLLSGSTPLMLGVGFVILWTDRTPQLRWTLPSTDHIAVKLYKRSEMGPFYNSTEQKGVVSWPH